MLVIMHHRNIKFLLQSALYLEALRRLDILKIDTSECRCDRLHGLDKLGRILLIYLNIKHIDTTIYLEKKSLSFHHWLTAERSDVSKSKDCCTV